MPNRIIREGFLTSDKVDRLSWVEECFYHRLLLAVDDYGRYHADPPLLIGKIMPRKIGNVSNQDIEKWLTACVTAGLVRVYGVDGKRYLEVLQFDQRTRAKKSKFPAPGEEKTDVCQSNDGHVSDICQSRDSHPLAYTETETETNTDTYTKSETETETKTASPGGSLDFPPPSRSSSMVPLPESVEEVEEHMRQFLIHPLDPDALRSSAERFYDYYVEQGHFIRNWKSRAQIWAKDDAYREQDRKRLEKQKSGSDPFPDSADLGKQFS